jgi:hypothetical protein
MSGPIVRKYGFPNFEKIFGERPLEHGVDEPEASQSQGKVDERTTGSTAPSGVIPKASAGKQTADSK